jgi:hypothetical protein
MTIDEAIQHCNEISCEYNKCANEHKQLSEWLIELKELRDAHARTWSVEDNVLIENICNALYRYALHERKVDLDEHAHRLEEMAEKLKALRLQSCWKPSDEQMEALKWQINNTYKGSWQYDAAKELYNKLKELKGE